MSIKTYRAIAELFETREQYWTCTFGNHDSESARSKEDFVMVLTEYEYFVGGLEDGENFKAAVFEADDASKDDFVGNYSIPIYKADGSVAYNVYVLDSGSYRSTGHAYSSITEEQTEWYLAESERLEKETGSIIPSLLFTHIPFIEVQEAYEAGGRLAGFYAGISLPKPARRYSKPASGAETSKVYSSGITTITARLSSTSATEKRYCSR